MDKIMFNYIVPGLMVGGIIYLLTSSILKVLQ
jgi:hypothetical protein